jgi:hypothetical protein
MSLKIRILIFHLKQTILAKDLQQIGLLLESNDDWERRNEGMKKLQDLIQKGSAEFASFSGLFEKHVQNLLIRQVRGQKMFVPYNSFLICVYRVHLKSFHL